MTVQVCGLPFLSRKISPFCLGGVDSAITAWGGGDVHIPRRVVVYPLWLSPTLRCSPPPVREYLSLLYGLHPVYRTAGMWEFCGNPTKNKQAHTETLNKKINVESI